MNKIMPLFNIRRLLEFRSLATRITADGKEIPKKKIFENRVTLIGTDNSVSITDLKNAQNLSLRRDLKLVKIQDVDAKTRRPVYRLMTNAEYHNEELQRRKEKQNERQNKNSSIKGEKLLTLSSRIEEHDLMTAVKKIVKLLEKQYEVKVVIAGEGQEGMFNLERICLVIETNVKSVGKMVQKRNKGNDLRFQLLPFRENSSKSANNPDSDPGGDDKGPL